MLHVPCKTIEGLVLDNTELCTFLNANNVRSVFIRHFYLYCKRYCKSEEFIENYINSALPKIVEYSIKNCDWKKELKTEKLYVNL